MNVRLRDDYAHCAMITRSRGSNFSLGFDHLPEAKRRAVHASYAFCRLADDTADDDLTDDADQVARTTDPASMLRAWRVELAAVYRGQPIHPVGRALADAVRNYPIPRRCFLDLIRGCQEDLAFQQPTDLTAVRRYCDLVATPIGEISLAIFGAKSPVAWPLGRHLSHALQWTNILRDVKEDALRGRVYLPRTWTELEGVGADPLAAGSGVGLARVLCKGIEVARSHYESARELPKLVEPDARTAIRLMTAVYREILDRIAAAPLRVLEERVGLSAEEKQALVHSEAVV